MSQDTQNLRIETVVMTDPKPSGHGVGPELVQEVADKVYAMLLHDLRLERERGRPFSAGIRHAGESWR